MAQKDLTYGNRVIERILDDLYSDELANKYAQAVLAQAQRNAASRPTPQARMAAANLQVTDHLIEPRAGGAAAAVAIGSEFGSNRYLQFQKPPNPKGYWLYPAASDTKVLAAGENVLDDILERAIHGQ